jgi:hypothetical protein
MKAKRPIEGFTEFKMRLLEARSRYLFDSMMFREKLRAKKGVKTQKKEKTFIPAKT